jgi:hypothetical protein
MRHIERIVAACLIAGFAVPAYSDDGNGFTANSDRVNWPRWQGRLSLGTAAADWRNGSNSSVNLGLGSTSLSLMSDYYLTGSLLGPTRAGGFRATSGVLVGPRSRTWPGPVLGAQGSAFSFDRRMFGQATTLGPADSSTDSPTVPYLGVGYTGLSLRGGWSFSADLGLMSLSAGDVRLGRVVTAPQNLDDLVRDMRWAPMVQVGVSYSF